MLKSIQSNNSPGHSHNRLPSVVDLSVDSCPGIILKRNKTMKHTQVKWGVHNPIYQGKKMTTKGNVSVVRVKDNSSPTGWKYPRYSPDNTICEFVEWEEKDRDNANLIASTLEMLKSLKLIANSDDFFEGTSVIELQHIAKDVITKIESKL